MNETFARAFALHQQGEIEQAKDLYESILESDAKHFDALHMLGVTLIDENAIRAFKLLVKAIEINPSEPLCFNSAGNALIKLEEFALALDCYCEALKLEPNFWQARANAALALHYLKRHTEALVYSNEVINSAPSNANIFCDRGEIYAAIGHYDLALVDFGEAIALDPHNPKFYVARGSAHQALDSFTCAIKDLNHAISLDPLLADAHLKLALLYLQNGNYELGWRNYAWRWKQKNLDSEPLQSVKPYWQPLPENKHLAIASLPAQCRFLVWAEQGLEDHIFFGGLLLELQKIVPHLIVQIDAGLIPLYERGMPGITFYPSNCAINDALYDVHLPMGDLAGLFRNNLDDFLGVKTQYLLANQEQVAAVHEQISRKNEIVIGIAWQSKNRVSGIKAAPDLEEFMNAFNIPGVRLVNLQYGDFDEDMDALQSRYLVDIVQPNQVHQESNLDGLATIISACDLIISADNITAHLAGALNIPCWLLLPKAPSWRWLSDVTLTPWYPSIRIYRQEIAGEWGAVLQKIQADLLPMLKTDTLYN